MNFIVDTQLPPRLVNFLNSQGYNCIHTTHFPEGHLLQNSEIIEIAKVDRRIIITKDSDFADYVKLKGAPPKILHLQFGNISNNDLIEYFEIYLLQLIQVFNQGFEYIQFNRRGIFIS